MHYWRVVREGWQKGNITESFFNHFTFSLVSQEDSGNISYKIYSVFQGKKENLLLGL